MKDKNTQNNGSAEEVSEIEMLHRLEEAIYKLINSEIFSPASAAFSLLQQTSRQISTKIDSEAINEVSTLKQKIRSDAKNKVFDQIKKKSTLELQILKLKLGTILINSCSDSGMLLFEHLNLELAWRMKNSESKS